MRLYDTIFFELSTTFAQALSDLPKVSIVTTSLSPPLSVICTSVPLCASFASSSFHLEVVLSKGKHGWNKAYLFNFSGSYTCFEVGVKRKTDSGGSVLFFREKLLHPFFARNGLHEFVELMFFFKKIVHCDLVVRLNDYSQQQP